MGRATIVDGGPEGNYTISLDYGVADVAAKVAAIEAELLSIDNAITEQQTILSGREAAAFAASALLDSAIAVLRSAEPAGKDVARREVTSATEALAKAALEVDKTEARIASFTLTKASLEGQIDQLENLPLTETRQAWCADYTEDAEGEVATIEVNGEQPVILLAPGAESPLPANGAMKHRMSMSPSATYFNAALLPGWQRFRPTYRVGQIVALYRETDTCDVRIDAATSSAQNLDINQEQTLLSGVPIEYMTCNSAAFETWDRVLVKLVGQDWSDPKVVGFESNPVACRNVLTRSCGYFVGAPPLERWFFALTSPSDRTLLDELRKSDLGEAVIEMRPDTETEWFELERTAPEGVPNDSTVQWVWSANDVPDATFFRLVLLDMTGEIQDWSSLFPEFFEASNDGEYPIVIRFQQNGYGGGAIPTTEFDWPADKYELRISVSERIYFHIAVGRDFTTFNTKGFDDMGPYVTGISQTFYEVAEMEDYNFPA